jgi:hypothetical protein
MGFMVVAPCLSGPPPPTYIVIFKAISTELYCSQVSIGVRIDARSRPCGEPEHEMRRKIIREWLSLPKDKRQTEEQAKPFARKAMERNPSSGDPYRQIIRWLLPRIGKP